MKNILFFIEKNAIILLFIVLQIINLGSYISYNRYPNIVFGEWLFSINVKLKQYNNDIIRYFSLKEINQQLQEENNILRSQLTYNYFVKKKMKGGQYMVFGNNLSKIDTIDDTRVTFFKQYDWIKTDIIDFVKKQNNTFLIIRGGVEDGIKENMAITSNHGIAGIIIKVYDQYSVATTLYNEKNKIVGQILRTNAFCPLEWINGDGQLLICKNFAPHTDTHVGDTVVTSTYSIKFPPRLPIGVVTKITENNQTRELLLQVKPFVNYTYLSQIYILKNKDQSILENIRSNILNNE